MAKKKPPPKKRRQAVPPDQLAEIVKRLESGESRLLAESKKLGFRDNNPLRRQLREHLDGKKQYAAMIRRSMKAREGPAPGK